MVDGMSDDGTRDILTRLAEENPSLRSLDNPGRLVSMGLNLGIRAAVGDIIVRMDAHTEYAADYVRQCVAVLQETGAANVGGPARTRSLGYVQSAIRAAYHSPFASGGARFHDVNFEGFVDTVTYGCWRREVFDQCGLFDEELLCTEDDEFNLRLARAGRKIWQSPRIRSWYWPRRSLRDLFRQYMQYGYWKVRLIRKHKIPASPRHLVPGGFLCLLIVLLVLSPWWPSAAWIWLILMGMYSACNILASFLAAARFEWKLLPLLPFVFACYHFSYGYGFLQGIRDFVVLRREPAHIYTKLTRK